MPLTLNGTTGITFPNGSAATPALTGADTDSGVFFDTDTVALTTAGTQRLTAISNGNIGIGTTNPGTRLELFVNGGQGLPAVVTGERMRIISNDVAGRSAYLNIIAGTSAYSGVMFGDANMANPGQILYYHADNSMRFYTNDSSEKLCISSSGNVGIGNTSPGNKLVISATNGSLTTYTIQTLSNSIINPNNSGSEIIGSQITVGNNIILSERQPNTAFSDRTDLAIVTDTGYGLGKSEKVRIKAEGDVGIGTPNPFQKLHIESTTSPLTLNLRLNKSSTTNDYAEIAFQLWNGSTSGATTFGDSGGTSRPSVVLRALNEAGGTAQGAFIVGTFTGGANNSTVTEKFRVASSGNVGIGTTNPAAKLHVSGGNIRVDSGFGIDFSAMANAAGMTSELLDDYETGTFTAALVAAASASGSLSYTRNTGRYTRIGNMVFISINISWNAKNSLSGNSITLSGLPFATASVEDYRGGFTIGYTSAPFTGLNDIYHMTLRTEAGSSVATFNYTNNLTGNYANGSLTGANINISGSIFISGFYPVN